MKLQVLTLEVQAKGKDDRIADVLSQLTQVNGEFMKLSQANNKKLLNHDDDSDCSHDGYKDKITALEKRLAQKDDKIAEGKKKLEELKEKNSKTKKQMKQLQKQGTTSKSKSVLTTK